jgi:hypothetical protein
MVELETVELVLELPDFQTIGVYQCFRLTTYQGEYPR